MYSETVNRMGYLMGFGLVDITPENESLLQNALVKLMGLSELHRIIKNY